MSTFSKRMGLTPVKKALQIDSLDHGTRNLLWNAINTSYWGWMKGRYVFEYESWVGFRDGLIVNMFKGRTDNLSGNWETIIKGFEGVFWEWQWDFIFDFIEYFAKNYPFEMNNEEFIGLCNKLFESESVPYRFVGKEIIPLTSETELTEIETVLSSIIDPIKLHFRKALDHLSDRVNPDYHNSIKESISAVECTCQIIAEDRKASLGKALKRLESKGVDLNPVLFEGLQKLYGYTNTEDGVRHAMMKLDTVDQDDARFMLVTCSAFVNYLIAEASKAGIDLQTNYESIKET